MGRRRHDTKTFIVKCNSGRPNAILAVNLANAGEGFSVGASATRAAVKVQDAGIDIDGDASGLRVFGQYMFNRNFGIEGGFSSFGEPNDNTIPSNMQVETEGYDLYAVAAYPMSENAGLFAKVGFASWNTETEVNDTNETHHSSTDLALSIGGEYELSEQFAIRAEIDWFDAATSGPENLLSLGAVWRFQ